jgi:ADP-ribose pyrophosphatase YjhB (NUDIX family)
MTIPDSAVREAAPITRLEERAVYKNRFVTVYDDDVRFSDGAPGRYVRVVQSGGKPGVVMLPVASGHVGLVRVYRYATGAWEWGLPRGLAHGDDPAATASTELLEELGARPQSLESLGVMTPDSGILASVVHLFTAQYPVAVDATQDTAEVAAVRWVPVPEFLAEIAAGEIADGFTLAATCRAICRRLLPA